MKDPEACRERAPSAGWAGEHFGPEALTPLEYLDVDWSATRWSNGCYGSFAPPGVYADLGPWLRRPIGVIRWAGTETSPMWTGYVEGAIRSGERASAEGRELLDAARPVTSPARGWAEPPGAASGVRFNRTWRWAMME